MDENSKFPKPSPQEAKDLTRTATRAYSNQAADDLMDSMKAAHLRRLKIRKAAGRA